MRHLSVHGIFKTFFQKQYAFSRYGHHRKWNYCGPDAGCKGS